MPIAAWGKTKYSCTGNYKLAQTLALKDTVPYSSKLTAGANRCISAALSRNTWSKYNSAWNAFKKFEISVQKNFEWPLQEQAYIGFVTWCMAERNLTASTGA